MLRNILSFVLLLVGIAGAPAWAANHIVTSTNFSFSPANLTIAVGDTVTFKNQSGLHNAHADDGSFECAVDCGANGGASSTAWSSTVTFNTAGTVTYHCDIHQSMGMVGTIVVQSTAPSPDFSLAAHAASASVIQGASVADAISITAENGFAAAVSFAATGLPSGVTASFTGTSATGTTLNLTASSSAAVGTHSVTVTGTSGSLSHSVNVSLTVTAATPPFSITSGITGSWYNASQSGQGFNIEVLPGDAILAFWYTFDTNGNNIWLVGQGSYSGDTATLQVGETTGGEFPPNFDPSKIVRTNWGTLVLTFSDCSTGTAVWTPIVPSFTSGSLDITRLSSVDGLSCP